MNFFVPALGKVSVSWGPIRDFNPVWLGESLFIIVMLTLLNVKGMKESSLFNEIIGGIDIVTESSIIVLGFVLAWKPELLAHQWTHAFPSMKQFMYGSRDHLLRGAESVAGGAGDQRATIVPHVDHAIFTVFIFAMAFSTLANGLLPDGIPGRSRTGRDPRPQDPLHRRGRGPFAALLCDDPVDANSGIMSASRLYSMSG